MSISVRVFDCGYGNPAADLLVNLSRDLEGKWHEEASGRTDADGYLVARPPGTVNRGIYRLDVNLDEYYAGIGITPLYPRVTVVIRITDTAAAHHVPLLFTPHAFMVYGETPRGSRLA